MSNKYQVLARKYRPGTLSELIGQDMLVQTLTNAINGDRIPHAFILTGIRGVGKTSTARIIARSLICACTDKPTANPCGECENCKAIAEDRHVDVLEIDAASRTGVSDIREIIENLQYKPITARLKIYIIDEVHMLSKSAFNALLKTLEEPPEHTKFIFATTEIRKIPITILSRCMRFDLPRVDVETLVGHLKSISEKEGVNLDENALTLIAYSSEGSVRDAISLLDRAIGNEQTTHEQISSMLGIASREKVFDLFESIVKGEAKEAILQLREIYHGGADPVTVLKDLLELTHFITQLKIIPELSEERHIVELDKNRGKALAEKLSLPFLARLWQVLLKGIDESKIAHNSLMSSEMILVRLAYMSDLPTPAEIIGSEKGGAKKTPPPTPTTRVCPASGGGEKERSARNVENFNKTSLRNFQEATDLFKEKNERFIHSWLKDVNPVIFDAEKYIIEFSAGSHTPPDLPKNVRNLLTDWTGNQWSVLISQESGEKSIREEKEEIIAERKKQSTNDDNVKAVLNAFPNASITNIREVS